MEELKQENRIEMSYAKLKKVVKKIFSVLLIIILALILIESIAYAGGKIYRILIPSITQDPPYRGLMEVTNQNETFVRDYIRDLRGSSAIVYSTYVDYKPAPNYKSKELNINSESLRENGAKKCNLQGKPIKIFMFGGSTMWGWGVGDDETIPAYLSEYLC